MFLFFIIGCALLAAYLIQQNFLIHKAIKTLNYSKQALSQRIELAALLTIGTICLIIGTIYIFIL